MRKYIACQSFAARDIGQLLDSHTDPCLEAIAQLWIFPQYVQYQHHWIQEVWSHFKSIKRVKGKNKFPSAKFIFQNTYLDNEHLLEISIESAMHHEKDLVLDSSRLENFDEFQYVCEQYFMWISKKLSSDGRIRFSEVESKLTELGVI